MRGGQSFGPSALGFCWGSLPFLEKGSFDFFDRISCPCPGLGVHVCVWGGGLRASIRLGAGAAFNLIG